METSNTEAQDIINFHCKLAAAGGFVMVPVLDFAAVSGVQVRMIMKLADHYGVALSEKKMKTIISTLIASAMPRSLAAGAVGSLVKAVPVIGHLASAFTLPALLATSTKVLGNIFSGHFSEGGTLLDIDKEQLKKMFGTEMDKAEAEKKAPAKTKKSAA